MSKTDLDNSALDKPERLARDSECHFDEDIATQAETVLALITEVRRLHARTGHDERHVAVLRRAASVLRKHGEQEPVQAAAVYEIAAGIVENLARSVGSKGKPVCSGDGDLGGSTPPPGSTVCTSAEGE